MSIAVQVGLISGKTAALEVSPDDDVGTLKHRAEIALGVGRLRGLLSSAGSVLEESPVQSRSHRSRTVTNPRVALLLPFLAMDL